MFICLFSRCVVLYLFFFFKQKTAYGIRFSDWMSDVCSSDLVGERSAEPVELPNDEDIAVAQRFQAGGKTGAIITATGCTIIIDIAWLDTGSAKGIVLQVERLRAVGFGHAGVADQHGSQTK